MGYPLQVYCYYLEPTDRAKVGLRRYVFSGTGGGCPGPLGYHNALVYIDECQATVEHRDDIDRSVWRFSFEDASVGHDDPRWPATCACGYAFGAEDHWQVWHEPIYRRVDTGDLTTIRDAGPGAMWDAWWYPWKGPDGRSLIVKLPNGNEWCIDARASNCDAPCTVCHQPYHAHYDGRNYSRDLGHHYVEAKPHACWVRHGEPPLVTVDKAGVTCGAGAGSIQSGNYHGFLRNGRFEP